ncbi:hypothetical protein [Nitrosomonas halophila]|uniref:Uncharacterized protein n=1 Tax=Nitrosomonas halophila TaxID=44576 RepID=A0A1H3C990_9PROT|nr:hypothetical protein [Nitrosomonas halophila]SDX50656.1 hypothetical protein SAMN05421881_1002108 [Nitrosomonas halophila]
MGIVSAVIVDIFRLIVYSMAFMASHFAVSRELAAPVIVGSLCAFIGAFAGKRILHKITLHTVRQVVAGAMFVIGSGLMLGIV